MDLRVYFLLLPWVVLETLRMHIDNKFFLDFVILMHKWPLHPTCLGCTLNGNCLYETWTQNLQIWGLILFWWLKDPRIFHKCRQENVKRSTYLPFWNLVFFLDVKHIPQGDPTSKIIIYIYIYIYIYIHTFKLVHLTDLLYNTSETHTHAHNNHTWTTLRSD